MNLASYLPVFRRELLTQSSAPTASWRLPDYQSWLSAPSKLDSYLEVRIKDGGTRNLSRLQSTLFQPFQRFSKSCYIEWRYFGLLSPEFQGIFGVSFFNTGEQFHSLAEGGLICIFAGTTSQKKEHICWQHVFPMHSVQFLGSENEGLFANAPGIRLRMEQISFQDAFVELSGPRAPNVSFNLTGIPALSFPIVTAEDFRRVPGAHWIVNNASPVAKVKGKWHIPRTCAELLGRRESKQYPNYLSDGFLNKQDTGCLDGSGYYEHSFGLNPMPLNGWDFLFSPCLVSKPEGLSDSPQGSSQAYPQSSHPNRGESGPSSFVMQTYPRSRDLRYLEVAWLQDNSPFHLRFGENEFEMKWKDFYFHPHIKANVPTHRSIWGSKNGFTIEVENRIDEILPFLRQNSFFVRHFFIAEEISSTKWTLRDPSGRAVAGTNGVFENSGGEVAYPRIFTPAP
jgi:hypothetical protein